jgi:hypothetical protein
MGKILTIQGVELRPRGAATIGTLKAVARLKDAYGVDLLASGLAESEMLGLLGQDGGAKALLSVLYAGDIDSIDEDELPVTDIVEAVKAFFGAAVGLSTPPGGGSQTPTETAPTA